MKRAVSFFDGQNLFHHAKAAFGHTHPNYDPIKLAAVVCEMNGWITHQVRFYTGSPILGAMAAGTPTGRVASWPCAVRAST